MLHLDTSVVVEFLRGNATIKRSVEAHKHDVAISTPVLAELYFGARRSHRVMERTQQIQRLMMELRLVSFDAIAAEAYGRIRNLLRERRCSIGEMDTLIGAVAFAHRATLVTRNRNHFEQVEGLQIEDWLDVKT